MRARRRLCAFLLAVAAALAGCTGEVVSSSGGSGQQAVPPSSSPPAPEATGQEGAGEADPHGDLNCDEATLAAIDATIQGQLDAFGADDYEAALGFSSSSFRAGTDPERFQALIDQAYPFLVGAGHTSTTCVADDGVAQVLVTIQPPEGAEEEMVYRLVDEDGEWRIDVAGLVEPRESETPVEV